MPFTYKTFEALQKNVLTTMKKYGLDEPFKIQRKASVYDVTRALYYVITGDKNRNISLDAINSTIKHYGNADYGIASVRFNMLRIHDNGQLSYNLVGYKFAGHDVTYDEKCSDNIPCKLIHRDKVGVGKLAQDLKLVSNIKMDDESIKQFNSQLVVPHVYVYMTQSMISFHYRVLQQETSLSSCMSRAPSTYERNGLIDQALDLGVTPKEGRGGTFSNHHHPLDAYEGAKGNVFLLLFTTAHHSEWDDEYPFQGRSMGRWTEGDELPKSVRYYGNETLARTANKMLEPCDMKGVTLREIRCEDGYIVAPYVDGSYAEVNTETMGIDYGSANVIHTSGRVNHENEDMVYISSRDEHYPIDETEYSHFRGERIHENDAISINDGDDYAHEEDVGNGIEYCIECCEYFEDDQLRQLHSGEYVHENYVGAIYFECVYYEELFHEDDLEQLGTGEWISTKAMEYTCEYTRCEDDGNLYHEDGLVFTADGHVFHEDSNMFEECVHDSCHYSTDNMTMTEDGDWVANVNLEDYLLNQEEQDHVSAT
jgi:hypothetical protein